MQSSKSPYVEFQSLLNVPCCDRHTKPILSPNVFEIVLKNPKTPLHYQKISISQVRSICLQLTILRAAWLPPQRPHKPQWPCDQVARRASLHCPEVWDTWAFPAGAHVAVPDLKVFEWEQAQSRRAALYSEIPDREHHGPAASYWDARFGWIQGRSESSATITDSAIQ